MRLSLILGCLIATCIIYSCKLNDFSNYDPENNFISYRSKPKKPGKCFGKSIVPAQFNTIVKTECLDSAYHYTGSKYHQDGIEFIRKEVSPSQTKWVKTKADKNCLSADPDDCIVWCLQETPAVFKESYLVTDTAKIKEWRFQPKEVIQVEEQKLVSEEYVVWKEVLCENHPNFSTIISELQQAFIAIGYETENSENSINNESLMNVVIRYQKENNLAYGQLDLETLNHLDLSY